MKSFINIILIVILISSCEDVERGTLISGQVVDRQTELPLSEICLVFSGYKQHGLFQPVEDISAHYISVDTNGRFNLQISQEDVDFYSSSIYKKNEGFCTTVPVEMEFLNYDCGGVDCYDLIRPGKKHVFLIKVFNDDGI
jgi:hypothetical protein